MSRIKNVFRSIAVGTVVGSLSGGVFGSELIYKPNYQTKENLSESERRLKIGLTADKIPIHPSLVITQNMPPDEDMTIHVMRGGIVGAFVACNIAIFPLWGITVFSIGGCYAIERAIQNGDLPPAL